MQARGLGFATAVLLALLAATPLVGCGASQKDANARMKERNEERAQRSLERARETRDPDRYRRIISRFPYAKATADARDELSEILVAQAKKAMAAEDWATAEDRALEAKQHGGVEMTLQATKVLDQIDDERAGTVAEAATGKAAEGKCASALRTVAATIRKKPRARYTAEVRKLSQTALLTCLEKQLEGAVQEGNIEKARMMIETPDATTAFSNEGYKKAHEILEKAIVRKSTKAIDPLLAAKRWKDAIAKLDEMRSKDLLNPRERQLAFGFVQEAIRKVSLEKLEKAMTAHNPKEIAVEVDADIAIADWKSLPDDLQEARDLLAVSIECERLRCRLGKPQVHWAWGKVPMYPPTKAEGSKRATLQHAQKVWVIGRSARWALLARSDPGKAEGPALLAKAEGWSPAADLKKTDTHEWLPPVEDMKGVRVWGPLHEKTPKEWILGVVQKVDGQTLTVKRMTDGLETEIDFRKIRLGSFPKGLRVYAFCEDQIHRETAKVQHVVSTKGDVPKINVKCDKGTKEKVEIASALTTRPEWLPRRRP